MFSTHRQTVPLVDVHPISALRLQYRGGDRPAGQGTDDTAHVQDCSGLVRRERNRAAPPAPVFCAPRVTATASAGTSRVTVEPAPTMARSPTVTGATSAVFEPMKAPAPISVRCLAKPS